MQKQEIPKDAKQLEELSVSKRMKAAEEIGSIVGKTIDRAVKKSNKFLEKYGYKVTVTLNFHELEKTEKKQ